MVPETLLKKRKSQEKERADKAQEREKKKKVRHQSCTVKAFGDDIYPFIRLALCDVVVLLTIFRD